MRGWMILEEILIEFEMGGESLISHCCLMSKSIIMFRLQDLTSSFTSALLKLL